MYWLRIDGISDYPKGLYLAQDYPGTNIPQLLEDRETDVVLQFPTTREVERRAYFSNVDVS